MKNFFNKLLPGNLYIWLAYFGLLIISIICLFSASSTLVAKQGSAAAPIMRHITFLMLGFISIIVLQKFSTQFIRYVMGYGLLICLHSRQNKKDVLSGAHPKYTQRIQGGTSLFLSEKSALSFCLRVSEYPCPFGPRIGCLQSVIRQQLHRFLTLTENRFPQVHICVSTDIMLHTLYKMKVF